ncbi:MAG: hypothetical protein ACM3N7_07910 [Planctomycetaceae bacterium]
MRYMSVALVLFMALAMGCASTFEGKRIDGSKTKNLMAEGTTPGDLFKLFGEPQLKENVASGEVKYVYYYRKHTPMLFFNRQAESQDIQRLEVLIKNNRVERYRFLDTEIDPITKDIPPLKPDGK